MCQSHTGRLTGLWFLPKPAVGLNTNDDDEVFPPHWKSFRLWDDAQKYGTAEDGSVMWRRVDAVCMLDNQDESQDTLVMFDTYYLSTARMVIQTPLSVMLYVHCLSCLDSLATLRNRSIWL